MLLIRARMAHLSSITAALDMISSPFVGMQRAVVLVLFGVFFADFSRTSRDETPDGESCDRSRAAADDGP